MTEATEVTTNSSAHPENTISVVGPPSKCCGSSHTSLPSHQNYLEISSNDEDDEI